MPPEQFANFSHLVQFAQAKNMRAAAVDIKANTMDCAGNIFHNPMAYLAHANTSSWILDSGASYHMSYDPVYFTTFIPLSPSLLIRLPNSFKVKVTHIGSVPLFPNLLLQNVLFVPSFRVNLIFVYHFCKQFCCNLIFSVASCLMQGPSVKTPLVLGKAKDGIYLLEPSIECSFVSASSFNFSSESSNLTSSYISVSSPLSISVKSQSDVQIWHKILGHMPFDSMKNISLSTSQSHFDCICDICPLARQTKLPFSFSYIKTKGIFKLIHVDTWGHYKSPTYNGFKYFLTIVDDYSRATRTYLLSSKSNAFSTLKDYLVLVERQFGAKIKIIRSDNALELGGRAILSQYFLSQGIVHQTTCVHTPQQNGVIERKHRHLLETSRALLHQSKVPISYWGDRLLTATFLINRFP
ncbi:hypothetical protein AABB24_014119 [Solanum stoloniferum]|uniref:Integrase catalytic domain-containing protein n=1 Tax=Solanum stoloniferum TaxID=62892 RepID=A0ABD2TXN7_9SOLN